MTEETPAAVDAKPPVDKRRAGLGCLGLVALCGMVLLLWPKADWSAPPPADAKGSVVISRLAFSDGWPFNVDAGVLRCEGTGSTSKVTFIVDNTTYAMNGTAMRDKKLADIHDVWIAGTDIGPFVKRGLALCK